MRSTIALITLSLFALSSCRYAGSENVNQINEIDTIVADGSVHIDEPRGKSVVDDAFLYNDTAYSHYTAQELDDSGFEVIVDAIPDALQEVRYFTTYNFVGAKIDGYDEPYALATKEAVEALRAVNEEVMQLGYRIKIYDAYRPDIAVKHFIRWAKDLSDTLTKPYFYPDLDKSVLFKKDYISSRSGHSRGSTVDLTLFDMSKGEDIDMGGTFDFFGEISHPKYRETLTDEQIANRELLRSVMIKHGFRPLYTEWWHFTLRDEPYPNTYFSFPVRRIERAN